jgi:hypothetical protein
VNGPGHCKIAKELLEHAARMVDTDLAAEDRAELGQRQAAVATMATAHATLAQAVAVGMSAPMAQADERAWWDVAATARALTAPPMSRSSDRGPARSTCSCR